LSLETMNPQVGHRVSSSSLQISTSPPHLGHLRYEGAGLMNCDMPGHDAGSFDMKVTLYMVYMRFHSVINILYAASVFLAAGA